MTGEHAAAYRVEDSGDEELSARTESHAGAVTLAELVARLGSGAGTELFARMDRQFRQGDSVFGATVRAARETFGAARTPHHARLVVPGRPGRGGAAAAEDGMVMMAMEDLEAVVKANQPEFSWAAEFAPRRDLPTATTPLVIRSGAPARRRLRP